MQAAELFSLKNRVALITGASSGLGAHLAEVAAANGASVVLVARRKEKLEVLKSNIEKTGGKAAVAVADVTDRKAMAAAFDIAEKAFGIVDVCVANAGIVRSAKVLDTSEAVWRETMATNLDGVFFTAQESAKRMVAAKKAGSIITIASVASFSVERGVGAYNVSKAGVMQATKVLALELARKNIRVNAIAPGYTATDLNREFLDGDKGRAIRDQIPAGRFGEPHDLDGAFLLLASDASKWITGTAIVVDGGHLMTIG